MYNSFLFLEGGDANFRNADILLRGGLKMLTVADMGEGGVKNGQKSADVLYGWPHIEIFKKTEEVRIALCTQQYKC